MRLFIFIILFTTTIFADLIKQNNPTYNTSVIKDRVSKVNSEIEKMKKLSDIDKLKEINRFFNFNIKYDSDLNIYGKSDHKATLEETILTMRGDCDDYVLAKLQALLYLGIDSSKIEVVISREKRQTHMKLYVALENKIFVLDNLNKAFRELKSEERTREKVVVGAAIFQVFIENRLAALTALPKTKVI